MKPTSKDFIDAVAVMALMIPFFPRDPRAQQIISLSLERFVGTKEQLDWLITTACSSMRDWEKAGGIPELRGIFCTRFDPADGISARAQSVGYTAEDVEAQYFSRERLENRKREEEYRQKQLQNPDGHKPFELPAGTNEFPVPALKRSRKPS